MRSYLVQDVQFHYHCQYYSVDGHRLPQTGDCKYQLRVYDGCPQSTPFLP